MSKKVIILVAIIVVSLGLTGAFLALSPDEPASAPADATAEAAPAAATTETAAVAAPAPAAEGTAAAPVGTPVKDPFGGKCSENSTKIAMTLKPMRGPESSANDLIQASPDVQISIPEAYVFFMTNTASAVDGLTALVDWPSMRPYCLRMASPWAEQEALNFGESKGRVDIRLSVMMLSGHIKSPAEYAALELKTIEKRYTDDYYTDAYGYKQMVDPQKIVVNRPDGGTNEHYRDVHFIPRDVLTPQPHYLLCTRPNPEAESTDCIFRIYRNNLIIEANMKWEWVAEMKAFYEALVKFADEIVVDPGETVAPVAAPAAAPAADPAAEAAPAQ